MYIYIRQHTFEKISSLLFEEKRAQALFFRWGYLSFFSFFFLRRQNKESSLEALQAGGKKQGEKGMHHRAKMKTGKPRKLSNTMEDTPTRKFREEAGDCPSHASRKRTLLYTRRLSKSAADNCTRPRVSLRSPRLETTLGQKPSSFTPRSS